VLPTVTRAGEGTPTMLTVIAILLALIVLILIASQISVQGEGSWVVLLGIIAAFIAWMVWG
jgi:hypothetical protein